MYPLPIEFQITPPPLDIPEIKRENSLDKNYEYFEYWISNLMFNDVSKGLDFRRNFILRDLYKYLDVIFFDAKQEKGGPR